MFVRRQSFRLPLAALVLLLAAFAVPAQETGPLVCPQPLPNDGEAHSATIQPLEASERLIYGIDKLPGGVLEVHYRVNGAIRITEVIDLDTAELPLTGAKEKDLMRQNPRAVEAAAIPRQERPRAERAIELLTLEPDSVRALHRLAREGAVIQIELLHGGRLIETLSFTELTQRSAALAAKGYMPVFARTDASGPGIESPVRTRRVATTEYLENCNDCTYDHPCETECGWDPGKGGPVTCGEQGLPCGGQPTCVSSYTLGEWWGPWTYHTSGYTGWTKCVSNSWSGDLYRERYTTYKRDRIRRTRTCPNAPSCSGCYDTDSVVSVQYSNSYCWENSYLGCSFPETACCGRITCSGFSISPCSYTWPCW